MKYINHKANLPPEDVEGTENYSQDHFPCQDDQDEDHRCCPLLGDIDHSCHLRIVGIFF